jgi:hypothetical protein
MGMGMGTGMFPSVFDDANEYVDVGPSRHSETADRSKNRVTFGDIAQTEDGGLMHDDIAEPEDRAGDDFKSGDGPSTAIDRQPFDLNYTSGFWSVSSCLLKDASELIVSHAGVRQMSRIWPEVHVKCPLIRRRKSNFHPKTYRTT